MLAIPLQKPLKSFTGKCCSFEVGSLIANKVVLQVLQLDFLWRLASRLLFAFS